MAKKQKKLVFCEDCTHFYSRSNGAYSPKGCWCKEAAQIRITHIGKVYDYRESMDLNSDNHCQYYKKQRPLLNLLLFIAVLTSPFWVVIGFCYILDYFI